MNNFPDFSSFDYEVTESLQDNIQGGRITYKAIDIKSKKTVVIKQFRFAKNSDLDSYKLIEREIEVLRGLKHPGIPKYIKKFDPGDGLCLVQEYKNADPLSKKRSFSPEEIKSIVSQVLEILIYLQTQIPIIIHRDIKPENILVDDNFKKTYKICTLACLRGSENLGLLLLWVMLFKKINVYLIDFGLARIGNHTMALSTIMGGTFGFMPPEQLHNQKLTEASDLYGLGATLICLITQTKSYDIGNLVNFSTNRIDFKDKVPKFSFRFIQWLEKMVEPDPVSRFSDAQTALNALQPLYVIRIPDVSLDKQELTFVAEKVGQKISQTIRLKNTVSETLLQGKLSVSPHPNDPPHTPDNHVWIRITPQQFEAHYQEEKTCTITIDTSKLKADKFYEREIILESNGKDEKISLKLSIQTAKMEFDVPSPPYIDLILFSSFFSISVVALSVFYRWMINNDPFSITSHSGGNIWEDIIIIYSLTTVWIGVSIILWWVLYAFCEACLGRKYYREETENKFLFRLIPTILGISTGIGSVIGFNSYLLTASIFSAVSLGLLCIYPPIKLMVLKAQYRKQESQKLIEP
ncbi:MAG: serine/threonine protein kinase [Crocosphaera sp.]